MAFSNSNTPGPAAAEAGLETITLRQLQEDITACRYDLDFCTEQLSRDDLTPQETRTLQLRSLDLGHEIRRAQHRIEKLEAAARDARRPSLVHVADGGGHYRTGTPLQSASGPGTGPAKRPASVSGGDPGNAAHVAPKRARVEGDPSPGPGRLDDDDAAFPQVLALQRLGFWSCRLCTSDKYKLAGPDRQPAAPCKWPLKDIAKMMTHYLDLHTEHGAEERCRELGDALARNRGPFEYWLRRTRSQKIDEATIDNAIAELRRGSVPLLLKNLSRAAAEFPGSLSK